MAALVFVMIPLELAWLMCLNFDSLGGPPGTPANALLVWDSPSAAAAIDTVQRVIGVSALLALAVLMIRRRQRASPPLKRVLTPVLAGATALVMFSAGYALDKFVAHSDTLLALTLLVLTAVPLIFLVGLLGARLARSTVGELVVELRGRPAPAGLRDAVARALRDPSLEVAYWLPDSAATATSTASRSSCRATGAARRRGSSAAARGRAARPRSCLREEPELLEAVAAAGGIALENEQLQAELRARMRSCGARGRGSWRRAARAAAARAEPARRGAAAADRALARARAAVEGKLAGNEPRPAGCSSTPAGRSPRRWTSCGRSRTDFIRPS